MENALRVVFLGTPDFASESLRRLFENNINIVAVVTAPDKPKGRGKKVATSAVKDYAVSVGIPVLQPTNLKSESFLEELRSYKADLQIVVAFRMLPIAVWDMPELGTFNLHASLLPQYRGAAPINWAIINGEKESGVTTFFLKHEIDTGAIIFQEREAIREDDTVGDLYKRLMHKGADLVLRTVHAIQEGSYPQVPQEGRDDLKPAPKIFKEDCEIDWNQRSVQVRNFIRGLSPYPTAWTTFQGKSMKVYEVHISSEEQPGAKVGTFDSDGKNYLRVKTSDSSIAILECQLEGKKRMSIQEFLRGVRVGEQEPS